MANAYTRASLEDIAIATFRHIDHGHASRVPDYFAPDGSITFGEGAPRPGTISGDAIVSAMAARAAEEGVVSRHVLTNFHCETRGIDEVALHYILTLFRTAGPLDPVVRSVADMTDLMICTEDGWKIRERTIQPIFYP